MGSVVVNHPRSDYMDTSYNMLGGAITSSESVYRSSTHHQPSHHPSSHLESGSSRSASSNTTPTSSTAPPSTSAAGSTRLPSHPTHDVPAYISRPSQPSSQPSTRASSATPGSVYTHPPSASMTSTTSHHPSRPGSASHPVAHSSSHHTGGGSHATAAVPTSAPHMGSQSSPASPQLRPTFQSLRSLGGSEANSPSRIKVRDLSHIQSFASEEFLAQRDQAPGQWAQERQYEISSMPVTDIIEMVAGLLMKITTTNDMHHESVHRHIPPPDGTTTLSSQATSVLAFHGKNVPSISILSYLTRIHKYCPTTYEVFLSLLVYFDRMTELVNKGQLDRLQRRWDGTSAVQSGNSSRPSSAERSSTHATQASPLVTPPSSSGIAAQDPSSPSSISPSLQPQEDEDQFSHFFVVDSFNIHRLVIAGVTCASKFFSDVFYTNSRYAKVGGLPLVELNHLELQFLLLNDFRLSIPVEELEAYGTMLVEFYAREIVAQQQQQLSQAIPRSINPSEAPETSSEGMYMRTREKQRSDEQEVRQTPTPP
ncbi:putative cyclin [Aspergillus niger ATCC 1015]|nr:putative cyclin [Aspergillus niger CBS 101883]EHA27316.1 putative cyclin [Aspergillus niger ATCC 1015]PYH60129.1 putative cyclin [Aspergillus niger CBS 101883]RDH24226.1 putative cyclin [Aspergillus niger ATCC 13496]RDK40395.1 putative cyclin [Aspergillus phoenicis ATCC 13157]